VCAEPGVLICGNESEVLGFRDFREYPELQQTSSADQQNSNYTSASCSPVLHRKAKEPSVMQCMASWLVRSVDEVSVPIC
jgi:hypothetical protein